MSEQFDWKKRYEEAAEGARKARIAIVEARGCLRQFNYGIVDERLDYAYENLEPIKHSSLYDLEEE